MNKNDRMYQIKDARTKMPISPIYYNINEVSEKMKELLEKGVKLEDIFVRTISICKRTSK